MLVARHTLSLVLLLSESIQERLENASGKTLVLLNELVDSLLSQFFELVGRSIRIVFDWLANKGSELDGKHAVNGYQRKTSLLVDIAQESSKVR